MIQSKRRKKLNKAPQTKFHIRKGDTVMVLSGKDRGKTGVVREILTERAKAIVEGINMVKKAVRPNPMLGQQGGIIEMEAPLHVSKLMVYDVKAGQPTRVRMDVVTDERGKTRRIRVSKKSGEQLDA